MPEGYWRPFGNAYGIAEDTLWECNVHVVLLIVGIMAELIAVMAGAVLFIRIFLFSLKTV
jgi:hypothetical protein